MVRLEAKFFVCKITEKTLFIPMFSTRINIHKCRKSQNQTSFPLNIGSNSFLLNKPRKHQSFVCTFSKRLLTQKWLCLWPFRSPQKNFLAFSMCAFQAMSINKKITKGYFSPFCVCVKNNDKWIFGFNKEFKTRIVSILELSVLCK